MKRQGSADVKVALIGCAGAVLVALIGLGGTLLTAVLNYTPPNTTMTNASPSVISNNEHGSGQNQDDEEPPKLPVTIEPDPIAKPQNFQPPPQIEQVIDSGNVNTITTEQRQAIAEYLVAANQVETYTVFTGDTSYAVQVFADKYVDYLQRVVADLNQQGLIRLSTFHADRSYIHDIRIDSFNTLYVDTCEIWSVVEYQRTDYSVVNTKNSLLFPQTITIEQVNGTSLITNIDYRQPPAFCQ